MALTKAQKDELVRSGKMSQYSGKSWDEVEKILNSQSSSSRPSNSLSTSSSNARTNGTDSGGNVWYTTPSGKQISIRPGADVILDDNGYFLGTRTQSGRPSYISEYSGNGGNYSGNGYSGDIGDMYDQQRKALIAQLRASIAKAKGQYTDIINKAPQTYQPLRNQTELTKEQQLAAMREALANQGNAGGTGRQELLGINTAAGNRMNEINLQQQNVVNDANKAISSLDEQAAFKESEINADTAAQKLQALLAEQQRAEELAAQQDQFNKQLALQIAGLTGTYNGVQTLASKQLENAMTQQEWENAFKTQQANLDNAYRNNQLTQQQYEFEQNRLFRDKQFEESVRQNNIAQSNWDKQFTYQQMQDKIQNALAQKRISQDSAQIALQQAKFKAEQDPNSLDNQIKKAQLQITLSGGTEADIRAKAAQLATASGIFDQQSYNAIYNALKGNTGYAADAQSNSMGYDPSNPYGIRK